MNARTYTIKLKLQLKEVHEVLNGLLHTILFYRSSPVGLCETTLRSERTKMVDFDNVSGKLSQFHHVRVRSVELERLVTQSINLFITELQPSDMERGSIKLEFFEKSKFMTIPITQTWEVWKIEVSLTKYKCELERIKHREKLLEHIVEAVSLMSTTVTSTSRAPIAFTSTDIPRIYDTSFAGFQPYNFKVSHKVDHQGIQRNHVSDLHNWVAKNLSLS